MELNRVQWLFSSYDTKLALFLIVSESYNLHVVGIFDLVVIIFILVVPSISDNRHVDQLISDNEGGSYWVALLVLVTDAGGWW